LDKALRHFQVIGTATDEQRKEMQALVQEIGPKLAMPQTELVRSASELLQAGLIPADLLDKGKDGVTLIEHLAGGAKVAAENLEQMATQLVVVARAFNMPWTNSAERAETLKGLMGGMLVAPRLSPDTPGMHARALAEFGPIAGQLGMSWQEASALQSVLSSSGFPGARGGMALKTILQRLLNPTFASQQHMQLARFDYGRVMKTDLGKVDPYKFAEALKVIGLDPGDEGLQIIRGMLKKGERGNLLGWKTDLFEKLSAEMGFSKRDVKERGFLKRSIDNVVATTAGGMDMIAFLEELSKLDVAAFKDFAGLHHASKAAVLKTQQAIRSYKENLERIKNEADGALAQGLAIKLKGFGFQSDRFPRVMEALRNSIWNAGLGDMATTNLTRLNDAILSLSKTDPETLQMIGRALFYLGTAGAGLVGAGAAVTAITVALRPLLKLGASFMASPWWAKVIAAGGLGALIVGKGAGNAFELGEPDEWGNRTSKFGEMLKEGEYLARRIGVLAGQAADGIGRLFGFDAENSALMLGVRALHGLLSSINAMWDNANRFFDERDANHGAAAKQFWEKMRQGLSGNAAGAGPTTMEGFTTGIGGQQPIAKLEGQATVSVDVQVKGGEVTGIRTTDGQHIKLNVGQGMRDTSKGMAGGSGGYGP
jgi:hypothetical protein